MVFVYSTKAHAKILSVDYSKALEMPGVKDYISHKDVPGPNIWGVDVADEEVFASSKVFNVFQLFSFSSRIDVTQPAYIIEPLLGCQQNAI